MRYFVVASSFVLLLPACSTSTDGAAGGAGGAATSSTTATTATNSATTTTGSASTTGTTSSGGMGDTWASFSETAFSTYCVECHNPADPLRNYQKLADVKADAALIRCGVAKSLQSGCGATPAPKQFPINNMAGTNLKPNDVTRDRIVAWIDAGLP